MALSKTAIAKLRLSTRDAYSYKRYKATAWRVAIGELDKLGFNEFEIETILRSKLMRWAADEFETVGPRGGARLTGKEIILKIRKYPSCIYDLFLEIVTGSIRAPKVDVAACAALDRHAPFGKRGIRFLTKG